MDLAGIVGVVGVLALAAKFTSFLKYLTNRDWNAAVTQLVTWVAATAAIWIYGASAFAETVVVGEAMLTDMNGWTKILVGLSIGSAASFTYDFKKALDNTDSAAEPKILPPGGS